MSTDLKSEVARLMAENAALKAKALSPKKGLTLKISERTGCVSIGGLTAQFPVSLYGDQWKRLNEFMPTIMEYIKTNAALLPKDKEESSRRSALYDKAHPPVVKA